MSTQLIRLTLLEGDPDGLRTAEIAGRTTKLIACPISSIDKLLTRSEARRTAVYFLYGHGFEDGAEAIYVGECDAVARRFNGQHHAMDKAEWRQLVVAFSSDAIFNKAHARRSEHLLAERVRGAGRAALLADRSGPGDLDEGDAAFAGQFVGDVATLAETLGFVAFRATPTIRRRSTTEASEPIIDESDDAPFRYIGETRFDAKMRVVLDDFIVLEGSHARMDETPGCADSIRNLRTRAKAEGILVPDEPAKTLRMTRDLAVGSTSAAGGLVGGRNSRGPNEWVHVRTGQTYAQWISSKQTPLSSEETPP